jgi:hypothetical protein
MAHRQPQHSHAQSALPPQLAAVTVQRRQSALGAFFRRMNARLGTPKAITATSHTLARVLYTMLKHGTAYVRQSLVDDAQPDRDRMIQHVTRPGQGVERCVGPNARGDSWVMVTSEAQFLGRSPVVKSQTPPRSGLLAVFPRRGSRPWRHRVTCSHVISTAGADRTWLRHTRMEARSPSRRRWHRDPKGFCGLETFLYPHTVLRKPAAER